MSVTDFFNKYAGREVETMDDRADYGVLKEIREEAPNHGFTKVRVIKPDQMVTMEYLDDRLNVYLERDGLKAYKVRGLSAG